MSTSYRSVVTLVQGTFATTAKWPAMEQMLSETLPAPVFIDYQRWSGRNRAQHRYVAAECLRKNLRDKLSNYPNAAHYVIAHSHAGNIALTAIRDSVLLPGFEASSVCRHHFWQRRFDRRRLGKCSGF